MLAAHRHSGRWFLSFCVLTGQPASFCDQFAVDTAAVPDIALGQINFSAQVSIARPQDAAMEEQISGQGGDTAAGYFPDPPAAGRY